MAKFDERAMRKEAVDLFGDKSFRVVISRPERPSISFREQLSGLAKEIADANPPKLCFDGRCDNEIRSPPKVTIFVSNAGSMSNRMVFFACSECSKKRDAELIPILQTEIRRIFGINPVQPSKFEAVHFAEQGIEIVVGEYRLGIVGGSERKSCSQALFFEKLLANGELPRFAFAYKGHRNCVSVTHQLYLDLKSLGIEKKFSFKEGHSALPKGDGTSIGLHRWIELDGWVIDASNGGAESPIVFQEAKDYYNRRLMTNIRDVSEYQTSS